MNKNTNNDKTYVNIAGWNDFSCDDGPGVRSVLFFQGCSKNCPGCHNASTHDPSIGKIFDVMSIVEMIEEKCHTHMITISGGEPLEQQDGLVQLLAELKQRCYNICLYTGWSIDEVPEAVLNYLDCIKVGGFVSKLSTGDLQYYGSSNQKMYNVSKGRILSEVA